MARSLLIFEHVLPCVNLLSIFCNDLGDGMECVLIKSADILVRTVRTPEVRNRVQSDGKLEKQIQNVRSRSV